VKRKEREKEDFTGSEMRERWRLKSHLFLAVLDLRVRERERMRANFVRIKC
jgi:hypothetical protein